MDLQAPNLQQWILHSLVLQFQKLLQQRWLLLLSKHSKYLHHKYLDLRPLGQMQLNLHTLGIQIRKQPTRKHLSCSKVPTSRTSKLMTWTLSALLSPTDIKWQMPLHEQLWPKFEGRPTTGKPASELKLLRKQVPSLTEKQLHKIFPSRDHSTITVVNPQDSCPALCWPQTSSYVDSKWHPMVQHPRAADDDYNLDSRLAGCSKVPVHRFSRSTSRTTFQGGRSLSSMITTCRRLCINGDIRPLYGMVSLLQKRTWALQTSSQCGPFQH